MGTNGQLGGESSLEGQVYSCQWVATPKGIRAWVTDQPKIAVETHTFVEAEEALADEILDEHETDSHPRRGLSGGGKCDCGK